MEGEIWKVRAAAASLAGRRHQAQQSPCEDAVVVRRTGGLGFYGLADGQSGKRFGRLGGQRALEVLEAWIRRRGVGRLRQYAHADELQFEMIRQVRRTLAGLAAQLGEDGGEFASTLVAFALSPHTGEYLTLHLGDGGILGVGGEGGPRLLSPPENGFDTRATWLTTSPEALFHLRLGFGSLEGLRRVVLFTDGAGALCSGRNIPPRAAQALQAPDGPEPILDYVAQSSPQDDASCLVLEVEPPR